MSRNATFITFMQIYARLTHVLRAQEHGDTLKPIHFTERFMQEKIFRILLLSHGNVSELTCLKIACLFEAW